ncbi:hypothetical protein Hanom_Chr04g00287741 [Helianthus anomalus]
MKQDSHLLLLRSSVYEQKRKTSGTTESVYMKCLYESRFPLAFAQIKCLYGRQQLFRATPPVNRSRQANTPPVTVRQTRRR